MEKSVLSLKYITVNNRYNLKEYVGIATQQDMPPLAISTPNVGVLGLGCKLCFQSSSLIIHSWKAADEGDAGVGDVGDPERVWGS